MRWALAAALVGAVVASLTSLAVARGDLRYGASPVPAAVLAHVQRTVPAEVRYAPSWVPHQWRFLGWGFTRRPAAIEYAFDRNGSFPDFPITYEAHTLPAFPLGVIVRV